MSGETFDILNSIFSGQKPLRRTNPKVGEVLLCCTGAK